MKTIEGTGRTTAPPAAVWALLADARAWSRWGAWRHVEVEGGGEQGPGAIRVLVQPPFRVRERITEWVPGVRMGYEMLDGMNVRGYRSTVTLEPDGDGTVVRWHSTYERAGPLAAVLLRIAVRDAARRVARAAGRS